MAKRKTKYDPAIAREILHRIATGESLKAICEEEGMPAKGSFLRWVQDDSCELDAASLADRYARAQEARADVWAEEIVSIADEEGDPQRNRLRVDARKWVASKLQPKHYGDRVAVEHGGSLDLTHRQEPATREEADETLREHGIGTA